MVIKCRLTPLLFLKQFYFGDDIGEQEHLEKSVLISKILLQFLQVLVIIPTLNSCRNVYNLGIPLNYTMPFMPKF